MAYGPVVEVITGVVQPSAFDQWAIANPDQRSGTGLEHVGKVLTAGDLRVFEFNGIGAYQISGDFCC